MIKNQIVSQFEGGTFSYFNTKQDLWHDSNEKVCLVSIGDKGYNYTNGPKPTSINSTIIMCHNLGLNIKTRVPLVPLSIPLSGWGLSRDLLDAKRLKSKHEGEGRKEAFFNTFVIRGWCLSIFFLSSQEG